MNITFERAKPADAEALLRVQIAAFHDDTRRYGVPLGGPPGYDSIDVVRRAIAEDDYHTIVCDGQIVGGLTVFDRGAGHYHLDVLFIDPAYHNRGIGTRAMQFVEQTYPAQKWTLHTPAYARRNQHFYEKFGYVKVGEEVPEGDDILLFAYEKVTQKEKFMSISQPDGYLALPASGTGNPVLVLHAWWGLNATIKAFCDRLAAAGFVAFAADLYHGKVADTIPGAETLGAALDEKVDQARADIANAVAFLQARSGAGESGIAVVGFSLGAFYALDTSVRLPDAVRSVVIFYGTGPADFSKAKAAYLGHYAENDPYEPPDNVDWLEGELKDAGRPVTFYHYPGTGHWFFEPDRTDAYDAAAAALSWDRTLAFLKGSSSSQP